jgi:hypothetical protein
VQRQGKRQGCGRLVGPAVQMDVMALGRVGWPPRIGRGMSLGGGFAVPVFMVHACERRTSRARLDGCGMRERPLASGMSPFACWMVAPSLRLLLLPWVARSCPKCLPSHARTCPRLTHHFWPSVAPAGLACIPPRGAGDTDSQFAHLEYRSPRTDGRCCFRTTTLLASVEPLASSWRSGQGPAASTPSVVM